ncbi:uncharacterized protein LOC105829539 [Monomorium pharaonis]|uniref:uncharacterized protein LOC105829539 n=1 Tax=Monomorium pharaonis TaxID=307658 RepID=UPI0017468A16|nr:uncharacterized protein LOC105829539 [Monomorium pharaonis]
MKYHVAENKSHKIDTTIVDRAATATTFDRPEIPAPKRPADYSNKVDVVNQKLVNFCAVRSTTKLEYVNIRAEERDAVNGERACAIQQSAIYDTLQSNRLAAGNTSERVIDPDSPWSNSGRMYRSERNGDAIEFAARGDLDVASHYRCYTSPRHCYRLPPQRTKQPLMGLCTPNRYIIVPARTMVGFVPRNSKPPIKEPNTPEKREKKDEKRDKEKKKPAIRTDGESVDSNENRAEMVADDNPRSDPDAASFRYEWGVKLAEEQPAAEAVNDNDKFAEKGQLYVTKRLWGVKLQHPKPDIAPATASSRRGAGEPRNASSILESSDTTEDEGVKSDAVLALDDSAKKSNASSLKGTIADYLSTPSHQDDSSVDPISAQRNSVDASWYMSSEELRKIMRTSPDMLQKTIIVEEYNVPEEAGSDTEITAWKNLVIKSISNIKENYLSAGNTENVETMSIRPEAPQPKLDVQAVRSAEDDLKDREAEEQANSKHKSLKSTERVRSPRRPDFISKKLHTMSTQIRYVHSHANSITQRHTQSLSSNLALVNRTMQMKYPRFFASTFSTHPEDSISKKVDDEVFNQQEDKQQTDSNRENEGKSNDPNSNDTLNSDQSLLESRTSSDQEQTDADFAKTLDVIADKEMEISINQLQSTDHKKIAHLSDSIVSSGYEIERYEESHSNYINLNDKGATYVAFDDSSIDSGSVKSIKKESSGNNTLNSNVDDDSSKDYIIDGDYVRLPGDPYPYSKENLDKWRVPRFRNLVYKPWKRETFRSFSESRTVVRSTLRNANDAYANAAGEPRDSHAGEVVMETSGSSGARKRTGQANRFHVSSQDQQVVSDCLRGDAADALGLRQWTEAFSRLDVSDGETNEVA